MKIEKVYLDMDGVLADFDRGVNEMCHMKAASQNEKPDPAYDDRMWEAIRKIDHFYGKLEIMPGAKEMFDQIYTRYGDRTEILTGIPKPHRGIDTAGEDKKEWMKRCLSGRVKVNIVFRREKKLYCKGPGCILIDDREKTILEWREMGGTGILHVSPEKTLEELRKMEETAE